MGYTSIRGAWVDVSLFYVIVVVFFSYCFVYDSKGNEPWAENTNKNIYVMSWFLLG